MTEIHSFEHAMTALACTFSIHFAFFCFDFARFYFYQTYVFYSDYKANIVAVWPFCTNILFWMCQPRIGIAEDKKIEGGGIKRCLFKEEGLASIRVKNWGIQWPPWRPQVLQSCSKSQVVYTLQNRFYKDFAGHCALQMITGKQQTN